MKKVLFFLAILFICLTNLFAQAWAPIGAKWTYTQTFAMSSNLDTVVIRSIGDTLIHGKICQVLSKNGGNCDMRPNIEFTYADSGKIFFFDASRNIFQMHYNFNANIGDKYKILPQYYPDNDSIIIVVDSISTVIINSVSLKKIFAHTSNYNGWWPYHGGIIIENIGDINYMFPWHYGACDAEFAGPLRCYTDTIIGFHDFGTAPSCDYVFLGVKENEVINNNSISPNPFTTSTQITLDKTYHNISLSVYDIQGKLMLQKQYADCRQIQLNRDGLNNGMYFLKLRLDERGVETGKVVVKD